MAESGWVDPGDWYETIRMSDDVTLVHEPWIKPFYRCNMWHVRGRDRDLLFDSGLGHFSLKAHVALVSERPLLCVASHTHFDHIGCHHEFVHRLVHRAPREEVVRGREVQRRAHQGRAQHGVRLEHAHELGRVEALQPRPQPVERRGRHLALHTGEVLDGRDHAERRAPQQQLALEQGAVELAGGELLRHRRGARRS